jgi:DNA invertase Pin-like site-specific DNA recombinase
LCCRFYEPLDSEIKIRNPDYQMKHMKSKSNTYVVYLRKSRQGDDDFQAQYQKCTNLADRLHLKFVRQYTDKGSGYKNLLHRPVLLQLMTDCVNETIGHVIVSDASRLSRNLIDGIYLWQWFVNKGIIVHVVETENKYRLPSYLNVVGDLLLSEKNYHVIAGNFSVTRSKARDRGMYLGGKPPLGFEKQGMKLIRHKEQSAIMDDIFACILEYAGHTDKISYAAMHRYLLGHDKKNASFIKTYLRNSIKLRYIVRNPTYTGHACYKEKSPAGHKPLFRIAPNAEHDKYITLDQYTVLNKGNTPLLGKTRSNDAIVNRKYGESYAMEIQCAQCGKPLVKNRNRYRCGSRHSSHGSILISELSDIISRTLRKYRKDDDSIILEPFTRKGLLSGLSDVLMRLQDEITGQYEISELARGKPAKTLSVIKTEGWVLKPYLKELLEMMGNIKESVEMSVIWKIHESMGKEREFIKSYMANTVFDMKHKQLTFKPLDPFIYCHDHNYPEEDIETDVINYTESYRKFLNKLNVHPVLPAILTFEKGIVTGDYWTDFVDTFSI